MAVCSGRGDRDGGHCCWIEGQVCEFLFINRGGVPRCSLWDVGMIGNPDWEDAPVGQWFSRAHPGFDCKDWPQNIPEVMEEGIGLCCWQGVSINGNLGS